MFCTACGTRNGGESNYCKQCGHQIDKLTPARISEDDFNRDQPSEDRVVDLLERAYRLRKEGDTAGAVALCEEALRLLPQSTSAHSLLGQLYEQVGERDAAIREYERVLSLNPGSIADRVKLDELRDGDIRGAHPDRRYPRIVLGEHAARPAPRSALVPAAMVVLAILCAGAASYVYGQRSAGSMRNNEPNVTQSSRQQPAAPGAQAQVAKDPATTQQQEHPANIASMGQTYAQASPYPPQGYPPQIVYVPVQPHDYTAAPLRSRPRSNPPARVASSQGSQQDDDSASIRIKPDEGHYEINVPGTSGPAPQSGHRTADSDPGNSITVHPAKANGPSSGSGSPTADSTALLQIANGKQLAGDFKGALLAYNKALADSGDKAANIHQHMAECYMRQNDKQNALENYRNALDEYQRMVQAGVQVDVSRTGILVCENGIKSCN